MAAAVAIAACNEDLTTSVACPDLCAAQNVVVRDTVLDAVDLDTSVGGYPSIGSENEILLASRGDTLDVRGIVRFDSLSTTFLAAGVDSAITTIDSTRLVVTFNRSQSVYSAPVQFAFYDVDTTAVDSSQSAVKALFRPDRLIGVATLDTNQIRDTTAIPLDNAAVLDRIVNKKRLRIGIAVSSTAAVQLLMGTVNNGTGATLSYDPSPDTTIHALTVLPTSSTPANNIELRSDLTDYQLVVKVPPTREGADVITVGGVDGQRAYLRFVVPSVILDSSTVLRATLLVTQRPVRQVDKDTPFTMYPLLVTAGTAVTEIARSAFLVASAGFDSLRVTPADSGQRQIEMVNALRTWGATESTPAQHAMVLRSAVEGVSASEVQFYSTRAAPDLRPRLRVSYATQTRFGIP